MAKAKQDKFVPSEEEKQALMAAGIQWDKIDWQKLAANAIAIANFIKMLIESMSTGKTLTAASTHTGDCCKMSHKDLACASLCSSLQTAHLNACHYAKCCEDECHEEESE